MSLRWKLARLRAMGPQEILYRVRQAGQAQLERRGIGLPRAREPVGTIGKPWFPLPSPSLNVQRYVDAADRILAGRFDIFAMRDVEVGFPPPWNRDTKTGTVAPLSFGKTLNYRDERLVGNIKYLWEPNRHLELVTLAQAWRLSREPRYALGCRRLIESWIEQCPYGLGPNWTSSLELAIRLLNWSAAWYLLDEPESPVFAGSEGEAFRRRWLESVYQHCHFIAGHFSRYSSANNHLLGELLGLFVASVTWPLWRESQKWADQAQREFEAQILIQNASDGVNKEQGIWYHHEVVDMMLIAALVGRANGREFGSAYWARWEAMLEYIASVMDVGGNVPEIGDSDDAVMIRWSREESFNVYRSLLATGAVLLNRPAFKAKAGTFDDKSLWLLGDEGAKAFEALPASTDGLPARRAFPEGGYYILGSDFETRREVRAIADAGPLGFLSIAAHGHADALSFTLSVGGRRLLIDPGTYSYSQTEKKWRDYFRGTSAHNTIRVDEVDQSVSGGPFLWNFHGDATCEKFETGPDGDLFRGRHKGYERLADPVTHEREIRYNASAREFTITDRLSARAAHRIELFLHFSEECAVTLGDGVCIAKNGPAVIHIRWPGELQAQLVRGAESPPLGWASHGLDSKTPCTTFVARGTIQGNWEGITQIRIVDQDI